ncbi:MAG: hypothetical protein M1832_005560 [Thelocarpon impressellum]|nr:MAG: hypothetical protein M1832_005560 [Thelocarpon impressellum]
MPLSVERPTQGSPSLGHGHSISASTASSVEESNGNGADTNGHLSGPVSLRGHRLFRGVHANDVPHKDVLNVACIGAGHVGGPTCAVIAYKNPHLNVTIVDLDPGRIEAWKSSALPIYEPGLSEIVSVVRDGVPLKTSGHNSTDDSTPQNASPGGPGGPGAENGLSGVGIRVDGDDTPADAAQRSPNLFFSTDVETAIDEADLIFVSVNTPTKQQGIGRGVAADLRNLEAATRTIARVAKGDKIIVEKSTVPCRTAETISAILEANARPGVRFDILSNPEFLAEGTAISDLLHPDRVLIGSQPTASGHQAAASLANIYAAWVPSDRIITMNLWSSELSKLAANALLAQRISSINALSALCEATGADVDEVAYACGLDSRIGPRMLKAGPGFGGSCFKKDLLSLVYLAESLHLDDVAAYWKSVVTINDYQKGRFAKRIILALFNTLKNKKIAVLGFAYKKDTGDTRGSAAIDLVQTLAMEQASLAIYDPVVTEKQVWEALEEGGERLGEIRENVAVCSTAYEACADADAVVIVTEWDEFSNKISNAQSSPTTAGAIMELDPNRVGVSQLATSASSASIKSLSGKLENVLSRGTNGLATPAIASSSRLLSNGGRTSAFAQRFGQLNLNSDGHGSKRLDWARIAEGMRKPKLVFDGRNIMDVDKLEKLGFQVEAIGKPSNELRR